MTDHWQDAALATEQIITAALSAPALGRDAQTAIRYMAGHATTACWQASNDADNPDLTGPAYDCAAKTVHLARHYGTDAQRAYAEQLERAINLAIEPDED